MVLAVKKYQWMRQPPLPLPLLLTWARQALESSDMLAPSPSDAPSGAGATPSLIPTAHDETPRSKTPVTTEEAEVETKSKGDDEGEKEEYSKEERSPELEAVPRPVYTIEERCESNLMRAEDPCPDPYSPVTSAKENAVDTMAAVGYSYDIVQGPTDAAEEILDECILGAVDLVEGNRFAGEEAINDTWEECIDAAVYYGECNAAERRRALALKDNILVERLGKDTGFDKVWGVLDRASNEVVRLTKLEETRRGRPFFDQDSAGMDIAESDEDALRRLQAEAGMLQRRNSEELKAEQEQAENC